MSMNVVVRVLLALYLVTSGAISSETGQTATGEFVIDVIEDSAYTGSIYAEYDADSVRFEIGELGQPRMFFFEATHQADSRIAFDYQFAQGMGSGDLTYKGIVDTLQRVSEGAAAGTAATVSTEEGDTWSLGASPSGSVYLFSDELETLFVGHR